MFCHSAFTSPFLAVAAFACLLAGCAGTDIDSTSEDVIGGTPDDGDAAVFAIVQSSSATRSLCSATLVAPHILISAAHCFVPDKEGDHRINWIVKGDSADSPWPWNSSSTATENLHPHPAYYDHIVGNDIAVVVLESRQSTTPILLNRQPLTDADLGSPMRFVGFGRTNVDDPKSIDEKNQVSLELVGVKPDRFSCNTPAGQPEAHTCFGDSGGPGLMTKDGVEYVAGVISYGGANCTGANTSTRVDQFTSFVDPYIVKYDPDYAAAHGITAP